MSAQALQPWFGCVRNAVVACALYLGVLGLAARRDAPDPTASASMGAVDSVGSVGGVLAAADIPAERKHTSKPSDGCTSAKCHVGTESMHNPQVKNDGERGISCVDCHGGNGTTLDKEKAHVRPKFPREWPSTANPPRSFALLNRESAEFIQFVNPGDLRVAVRACGNCHAEHVRAVRKSMMTHGAMLWGAALYNNGSFPLKDPRFGESYDAAGAPQRLVNLPLPTVEQTRTAGLLPFLDPLPRWEVTQMGNLLRVFERGGGPRSEIGNPNRFEEAGKPDVKLSNRGLGTLLRTDPVFLGLQKTRLLDPMLSFLGTNDHPGDYRSSGCSSCHVLYANDRNALHSGPLARFGHLGQGFTNDRAMQKERTASGHPVKHQMTSGIPSSQCISCHHHPGTTVTNSYLGYTWWDNETHADLMFPRQQRYPSADQETQSLLANPEGAAARGNWSDSSFLNDVTALNTKLTRTQFADFTPHGWIFRAVFKQDRKGNLLDAQGKVVPEAAPGAAPEMLQRATIEPFRRRGAPVHLRDIHLEKGMHCVDCHFSQDAHGNGNLYGETRNAVEIDCRDCHGTATKRIERRADLRTSGPAAPMDGTNLARLRTPYGENRFEVKRDGSIVQRSMVEQGREWVIPQVADTIDPDKTPLASYAHTLQRDGATWGRVVSEEKMLAHGDDKMACYTCHSSWTTSCSGCHLKMQANRKMPQLHNEGGPSRNYTSYNFQTLRDDLFMLGKDASVPSARLAERYSAASGKCQRVMPMRSSCAVYVSSQNQNREWLYFLQQTVSAEGHSGHAFNPHVPHTVGGTSRSGRLRETRMCTDCHLSQDNDNNAWMAQLLMQGTNLTNFIGRWVYVAEGEEGFAAVAVTEREEPQAVIGSRLYQAAYPDDFRRHQRRNAKLNQAHHHEGHSFGVQLRGEYLYSAEGERGLRVYDVANIENKGFSERMTTAPVSPWGQRFYVQTKHASAIAAPSTMAVDPARRRIAINEEQPVHPLYAYLYVADKYEGLILINAATLLDGNPTNNFLRRALTWNEGGMLNGARSLTMAGNYVYVCCDRGVIVLRVDPDPRKDPLGVSITVVAELGESQGLSKPRSIAVQFRRAFVCDEEGLKVIDITNPETPQVVRDATLPLADTHSVYVARTFAYVAAGRQGLVIVDIERPDHPRIDQVFTANGAVNDARDVKVAMTNASAFAYVADGSNGLRVIQLTSPADTPTYLGFSPRPSPRLIATYPTRGAALAVSEGIDRDRAVDESGNQVAVFGRRGARPFNLDEQQKLYLRNRMVYTVSDDPPATAANRRIGTLNVAGSHGLYASSFQAWLLLLAMACARPVLASLSRSRNRSRSRVKG